MMAIQSKYLRCIRHIKCMLTPLSATSILPILLSALFFSGISGNAFAQDNSVQFLNRASAKVAKAAGLKSRWEGPTSGPRLQKNKKIVYIAGNMNDGAIAGIYNGFREATTGTGWQVLLIDCRRQCNATSRVMSQALEIKPDGIVLAGVDANSQKAGLAMAHNAKVPVVGWHASINPGPIDGLLFTNITNNVTEAAQIAALYGVVESNSKAGMVIFTDSSTPYSTAKSKAIIDVIRQCDSCRLLSVEELPASDAYRKMQVVVEGLEKRFGAKWTHSVAVSDLYFDLMEKPSIAALLANNKVVGLSAGDGSPSAYKRIRSNTTQIGTIPEPLLMHSWQIVDELNRAFSGAEPSGMVTPTHLVTNQNIAYDGGPKNVFDPSNDFRAHYQQYWGK